MKNQIKSLLILITLIFITTTGYGQVSLPEPMQPLSVLLGTWTGSGYQSQGQNNRIDFKQTEEVTTQLGGKLLVFHGTGVTGDQESPGFEAFGVMTYDEASGEVYLHAWTKDGRYTKADVEISEGHFKWAFDVPNGGRVRYTTTFDENHWQESGEYSPDNGSNWYPFLEMELTR